MREMLKMVLFVFVLGTDNASYSLTNNNGKKLKKDLTHIAILLYDQV